MNSEVWLRAQYQTVIKERDQLQTKLKYMERENQELRKSVFDLSYQLSQLTPTSIFQIQHKVGESNWKPMPLLQNQQAQLYFQESNSNPANSLHARTESDAVQPQTLSQQQVVLPLVPPPPQLDMIINNNDDKRAIAYETEIRGHAGAIYCSDISADNRYIATGSFDKTIIIWDVSFPYKMRCCLNGHTQLVSDLCWALTTPCATSTEHSNVEDRDIKSSIACKYLLYSISFDKTMRIWDPESKTCLSVIKLKGLGTSLSPCMPSFHYPMGFMVATTSTQYMYIVENSTVLLNQRQSVERGGSSEGGTGKIPRDSGPVAMSTDSNSGAGGVPVMGGSGAVFYKHTHVATSAVCYVDPQHGCGVFLGDISGCVSFYKIGPVDSTGAHLKQPFSSQHPPDNDLSGNSIETPVHSVPPLLPVPAPTPILLTPAILGQQSLFNTHFHSSSRRDSNADFRLLHMKLCGKGQADVLSVPPMMHQPSRQHASQAAGEPTHTLSPRVQHKDTLLAVQCSDHCIRLYAVEPIKMVNADSGLPLLRQRSVSGGSTGSMHSNKSIYSQADATDLKDINEKVPVLASEFLRPIRILEGHTTGEWSIKMNFICGDRYDVHLPPSHSPANNDISGRKMSGSSGQGGKKHRPLHLTNAKSGLLNLEGKGQQHQTTKAAYRNIIPVDSGGGSVGGAISSAAGTGAGAGGGSGHIAGITVAGLDIPALVDRSYYDEASPRGRRSRSQSRGSSVSDDKEYDSYYEKEKGSEGGEQEGEGEEDNDDHDSLLDDDDDDNENDLSMIAGLVSSQFTDDAVLLDNDEVLDGLDHDSMSMSLAGAAGAGLAEGGRLKTVLDQQRLLGLHGRRLVQATEWDTSLMLATGCSKGKVFIYDISALSNPDTGRTSLESSLGHSKTASPSKVWKVLHAQSAGKSYGVSINKSNTTILTYGSESSLKAWSLSNSNDLNK